jgi:hypothetical protein
VDRSESRGIYPNLIGLLNHKPTIWTECLFVDPIADIAVLGSVDGGSLPEEADAYDSLFQPIKPIPIGPMEENTKAWLLSLKGEWFECEAQYVKRADSALFICNTAQPIQGGMSGSPVLSDSGKAIGVVAASGKINKCEDEHGIKNPRLVRDLPGWMLGIHSLGSSILSKRKRQAAVKAYLAEKMTKPKIIE